MFRTLKILIAKEFKLELRRKSVIAGLALYLVSIIFICYLTFKLRQSAISEATWAALFWLAVLFSVINTVAKSFVGERRGLAIYYFSVAAPQAIMLAKMIYNAVLCLILSITAYFLFYLFLSDPVFDHPVFFAVLLLTSCALASALSLMAAISARASNSNVLMAVLSFPVVISTLLMAVKATKNVLDGLPGSDSYDELLNLFAINCITATLAYLLFPYIWRS